MSFSLRRDTFMKCNHRMELIWLLPCFPSLPYWSIQLIQLYMITHISECIGSGKNGKSSSGIGSSTWVSLFCLQQVIPGPHMRSLLSPTNSAQNPTWVPEFCRTRPGIWHSPGLYTEYNQNSILIIMSCKSISSPTRFKVFTLPHEFQQNPLDSNWNVRIAWNSDRIHLAGASAILVFHSMEFPTESDGIWQNQLESRSLWEWFPLESIGMCWNPLEFAYFGGIPMDSNRFQQIPMDSNVCLCYYYNIKKKYMSKDWTIPSPGVMCMESSNISARPCSCYRICRT